jgi:hypothetical protein
MSNAGLVEGLTSSHQDAIMRTALGLKPPFERLFLTHFSSSKMPSATHSESTTPFLNIIETNLFVDADSLLANITAATKGPDGLLDWIELKPKLHGSLVKCATRLVSRHTTTFNIASAKEALFTFLINLLNGTSRTPFLEKTEKTKIKSASNCMTRKKPEETEKSKDDASAVVTKRVTTRRAGHDKAIPTETTHTAATATPQ